MKTHLLTIGLSLLSASAFAGNEFTLTSQKSNETEINFHFDDYQLSQFTTGGEVYDKINAEGGLGSLVLGTPNLPYFFQSVVIPYKGKLVIDVENSTYTELNNINIEPSKGNLYRNVDPSTVSYVKGNEYSENKFFPSEIVQYDSPFNLRGVRGASIKVTPFQYNPVTKTLRVYSDIAFKLETDVKLAGINEVTNETVITAPFKRTMERQFINHSSVKYTPKEETGSMLIIADDGLMNDMETFVNWKIKTGIPTEMVGISEVGNSESQIKSFVEDYYSNNPEFTFLLFVGDHGQINTYDAGMAGQEVKWSDSYYSFIDGNDHYPEIFIGRFSANNSAQLQVMLDRNMEYEVAPMSGDWYQKAIGLGSDEGAGYGDNGESDWQHLRAIRSDLMNYGFTEVFEFYDGSQGGNDASGNPNSSDISDAVDAGITLFNYTGHGAQNVCVTGNFGSSHINAATNNGKYPYVVSVACNNGTFTSGTCISEVWQRASNSNGPTGAIMAAGSSILMSWAPPMLTQDELVDIMVESYANNKKYTLGGLFYNGQMKCLDAYGNQGKEVMETWVFFGDPSAIMRTVSPVDLTAIHVNEVVKGEDRVDVSCNVEGARIALTQNGISLGSGFVSNGEATIDVTGGVSELETIDVVATAYNHVPYQGEINVVEFIADPSGPLGYDEISVYPNPGTLGIDVITLGFNLEEESNVELKLVNALGQEIYATKVLGMGMGSQTATMNIDEVSIGSYYIKVDSDKHQRIAKFIVK